MSNLVAISLVVNALLLVALIYLFFLRLVDKGVIDNLANKIKVREAEIKSLREYIDNNEKERKLYTFDSGTHYIENVVGWREFNQQLRLDLDDGSRCVVSTPAEYKLIVQDQSEEGTK